MDIIDTPLEVSSRHTFSGAIPDEVHTLSVRLLRCSDETPDYLPLDSAVSLGVALSFDAGATWPVLWEGGVINGGVARTKLGIGQQKFSQITYTPLPLLCSICGNQYIPGDPSYIAGPADDKSPDYIGQGALSHSTIALRPGATLAMAKDVSRISKLRSATNVDHFRLNTLPGWADKELFERVFHTPTPLLPARRAVRVTVNRVTGPSIIASHLLVEAQ